MKSILRTALLAIVMVICATSAHATIYQYNVTFRITDFLSVDEPFGPFVRGEDFSGHFTIDTSVAQNGSFGPFERRYPNAAQIEFSVHGVTFAGAGDVLIDNGSNWISLPLTFASRPGDGWTRTPTPNPLPGGLDMLLDGQAAFSGPHDLASWPAAQISIPGASLSFGDAIYTFPNGSFQSFAITGDALSLSVLSLSLLPEPSTLGLAAIGLATIAGFVWRRRSLA